MLIMKPAGNDGVYVKNTGVCENILLYFIN